MPFLEVLEARALLTGISVGPVDPAASVFVRFSAGMPASRAAADLKAVGGQVVTAYPDGSELVALPSAAGRSAAIGALTADPGVVYAEATRPFTPRASRPPLPPRSNRTTRCSPPSGGWA